MHKKDVESEARSQNACITLDASKIANFKANKPIRVEVKEGRKALFFDGSQSLVSQETLPEVYRYNSPFTISVWALQTKADSLSTLVSLSSSWAELVTTEMRLGTDKITGLVNHNGWFESSAAPEVVKASEGHWHHWVVTFDGWKERIYRDD
jgi:hypothetical protein